MPRLVTAGAVGKPHGLDGSFMVDRPTHELAHGTKVQLSGATRRVERRAGTDRRPLVRLTGIVTREAVIALRGEPLLVTDVLEDEEWLAEDLVGCRVADLGRVARVIDLPSCDVLELDDGRLVPLVADAIAKVDVEAGTIEIHPEFLGLGRDGGG